jgi:hypothetical protein
MECRLTGLDWRIRPFLLSVIRGLISKGLIDQAEARLWLNNAATLIEEDKTAFTKSRGEAITIIREELVSLLD